MKKIILYLIGITTIVTQIAAMEKPTSDTADLDGNTIMGEKITEENLYKLAQKHAPLSEKIPSKVDEWMLQPQNQELINTLSKLPRPITYANFVQSIIRNHQSLKRYGYKTDLDEKEGRPNYINYVFQPTEDAEYFIKIGGVINKLYGIVESTGTDPWTFSAQNNGFSRFPFERVKKDIQTHQTTSRMAHYLRVLDAIKKYGIKRVIVPKTYLYPIFDKPEAGHDENFVVIQEKTKNAIRLADLAPEQKAIVLAHFSEQTLRDLYNMIKHAALWNAADNIMVKRDNTNELIMQDFEQPNNNNPNNFFYGPGYEWKYYNDAVAGIDGISDMLKSIHQKQFEKWINIVKQDQAFLKAAKENQPSRFPKYIKFAE